ncbi:MAG: Ribosome maturation factor RimM [Firmicutes bacterium ADurb.Bin193]|nr:MAG: Ribosome maturation factor RimM [Firmicutes bacterium ADurb.Bin193]
MDELLEIGKLVNTHGLKGEVKVTPWCDDADIFTRLESVTVNGENHSIENVRFHKGSVILKLDRVDSIDDAERLKNKILYTERSHLGELNEDTYYIKDLIGLEVYEDGQSLGIIDDCFPTGSNDVYVVKSDSGKQILIPAIKQVIKKVDIKNRRMDVELMEGLRDED